ncbi:hypothetical protein D3C78_1787750 [compost metagenome]
MPAISCAAPSLTATTSLPSTWVAAIAMDSARALAARVPAVMGPERVVAEIWLSSQTNSTGSW